MAQYLLWIISFCSLYLAIVWITFLYFLDDKKKPRLKRFYTVTIAVPAYNEEEGVAKTIHSLAALHYPQEKIKIVVINDGSTDRTAQVVNELRKKHGNVTLINKKNAGKAAALNTVLKHTHTELFAVVDADSSVHPESLRRMIPLFEHENTAAVISAVKVDDPKNIFEKLQKLEYIIAIQSRKLMESIDTLAMTPGVLSVYKTAAVKNVHLFDKSSITEDFEIALKLKYNGYNIRIAPNAETYTTVPNNFYSLWRQRIRWYRGYIDTHLKYRDMFFSRKYGIMGSFQMPLNILGILFMVVSIGIITYEIGINTYEFILRSLTINNYFYQHLFEYPSLKDFILSQNLQILFPVYLGLIAAFLLFYTSHKFSNEKITSPISIWVYFFLLPYLSCIHWMGTVYEKVFGVKKKW